ncbi:PRD domain-containing protein [Paludicola sp. MB14-C6]|uniref:PRD domain-containing protein n=1 Tax=Paludihabitans sp. MB14-C6 TaxID=3070656 RepID=UPI0027DDB267|nr:PRD domain-containing protein [Paludicola sp. MB14-C6]WMJ22866.1 PRD domain-containing protein [Paludicola sp. MB14-C6]
MKIIKPINNNIVSAYDSDGHEVILMGRGIGYKAKENTNIPDNSIEKIFFMDNQDVTNRLKKLLLNVPMKYIEISDEIINYAKNLLHKELNQAIYVTLIDHINFAIMRYKKGLVFQNVLLMEVRRFYFQEYSVGKYALELIENKLGISFPEDEAASIALHIVNAEYETTLNETMDIARIANKILEFAFSEMNIIPNKQSANYEIFVTYLKFLAQNIVKKENESYSDPKLNEVIALLYPDEYKCSQNIALWVEKQYDFLLSEDEIIHITLYIRRNKEDLNKNS